jgi:hypothetical protein
VQGHCGLGVIGRLHPRKKLRDSLGCLHPPVPHASPILVLHAGCCRAFTPPADHATEVQQRKDERFLSTDPPKPLRVRWRQRRRRSSGAGCRRGHSVDRQCMTQQKNLAGSLEHGASRLAWPLPWPARLDSAIIFVVCEDPCLWQSTEGLLARVQPLQNESELETMVQARHEQSTRKVCVWRLPLRAL